MIDVSELHLGDSIHVNDITPDKFEILTDDMTTVVHIVAPRVIEVVEEVEEGEELEEGEEPAEPEVIGEEE